MLLFTVFLRFGECRCNDGKGALGVLIVPDAAITLLAYAYAVYGSHKRAKGIVIHKKRLLSFPTGVGVILF